MVNVSGVLSPDAHPATRVPEPAWPPSIPPERCPGPQPTSSDEDGRALLGATESALGRGEFDQAVGLCEQATQVAATEGPARYLLGGLRLMDERYPEAAAEWETAFRVLRRTGQRRLAARAALELADVHAATAGHPSAANGWREHARRCLDGEEPCVEHGYIELAVMACDRLDAEDLLASTERALAVAVELGDADLEARALSDQGLALVTSWSATSCGARRCWRSWSRSRSTARPRRRDRRGRRAGGAGRRDRGGGRPGPRRPRRSAGPGRGGRRSRRRGRPHLRPRSPGGRGRVAPGRRDPAGAGRDPGRRRRHARRDRRRPLGPGRRDPSRRRAQRGTGLRPCSARWATPGASAPNGPARWRRSSRTASRRCSPSWPRA